MTRDRVHLRPYTNRWKWQFFREKILLRMSLGRRISEIHHVGSTAVRGMIAKPVIDIIAEVPDYDQAADFIDAIEVLGYEHKGENPEMRQYLLVKGDPTTHTLYLVERPSQFLADRLRFRDCLVQSPEAAQAYTDLKRRLVQQFDGDLQAYQEGKADFVRQTLRRCEG
jgi:GrpB-like predicted nucleotidyltransferase (UPF0157 family)